MKVVSAAVLAAAVTLAAMPAKGEVLDLATVSCKEMFESEPDVMGSLIFWLSGYYTEDGDPTVIDSAKMEDTSKKLGAYCALNPTMGILSAAEEVMGKEE